MQSLSGVNEAHYAFDHTTKIPNASVRNLTAKVVVSEEERNASYRIRYRSYHPHGFVPDKKDGLFCDAYDVSGYATSFVISENEEAIATLRLCRSDAEGGASLEDTIPCAETFGPEIMQIQNDLISKGRPPMIAEVTRLAKVPEVCSDNTITLALFKMLKYLAMSSKAEIVLVAVRFPHIKFYRRLGFRILEAPRFVEQYNTSLALMGCDRDDFAGIESQARLILRCNGLPSMPAFDNVGKRFLRGEAVPVFPTYCDEERDPDEGGMPLAMVYHTNLRVC